MMKQLFSLPTGTCSSENLLDIVLMGDNIKNVFASATVHAVTNSNPLSVACGYTYG